MARENWTDEALRAVASAQDAARNTDDSQVCTEHLLLGVLEEDDPLVRRLFEHFSIPTERLRQEIGHNIVRGDAAVDGEIPLAPRVRRVMDLAEDEAHVSAGSPVRPAHLLLGLLREGDGLAGRVLSHLGARPTEEARKLVAQSASVEG